MERIQLSTNLYLDEYIPEKVYKLRLDSWGKAWIDVLTRKINPKLIAADQSLRDRFGEVTINNWWNGGSYQHRGLRFEGDNADGASPYSDHWQGNASDKNFKNATPDEVREWLKQNGNALSIYITVIEEGVNWVHSSVAWTNQTGLKIVTP